MMLRKQLLLVVGVLSGVALAAPQDLSFRRVWTHRGAFEGELAFPDGVSFLPMAQYAAEVTSLPSGLRIQASGKTLMTFAAPTNVAPPYVMRLSITGNSQPAVFVTKDGRTDYSHAERVPTGVDLRRRELMTAGRVEAFGGAGRVRAYLSDGAGRADIRFVTRGREGMPYLEDGRLFYTFSVRHYGSYLGVGSLDPRHPERGVRFEGVIGFDYGDGLVRNDVAAHLFYDEEADEWRGWSSNFSTGSDSLSKRAPGGLNAVWSKTSPLHGFNIMQSQSLGLTGMNEDPCGIWDGVAKKWRLFVSEFTQKDIRASLLESDDWKGPYVRVAGPVPENATGTTLVSIGGVRYGLAGSSKGFFRVFSYPSLERIGRLRLDPEPWGQTPLETPWGMKTTKNARDWPSVVELPEGWPYRYLLLTMDRVNIPGVPNPNWTYGGLHLYVADAAVTAAFSPNDFPEAADDSAMIQAAVDAAVRSGDGRVVIPPRNARTGKAGWTIARAILLPSDVTVILDNCRLTMADDVYENFFRSANAFTDAAKDAAGALRQIRILGRGAAVLDGGKTNDLCEATSGKDGRPNVRWNCPILFTNVRDFEVSGLRIENHRYWGMCFEYCYYGKIADIRFIARYDRRNQDGINLRNGCHEVVIENVSGQTGDDMIALSPIDVPEWSANLVTNLPPDIAHVTIRNVRGAAVKHPLVAVRCANDARVYDIVIENIADTEFTEPTRDCEKPRYAVVRIGNSGYCQVRQIDLGQLSDITVRNVDCRHSDFGVLFDGKVQNALVSNVRCHDPRQGPAPRPAVISTAGPRWAKGWHATLDNVTIENCLMDSKSANASICDCGPMKKTYFFRDVRIVNCTLVRDGVRKFIPCEDVTAATVQQAETGK